MEDRLVPATIHWIGANNADWGVAANWDLNRVPIASDDVVINKAPSGTVVHSSGTDTVNSLNSTWNLTFSGGALTVSDAFTEAAFHALTSTGGSFTVNGATTFDGVSLSASGGGSISLLGASSYINTTNGDRQGRTWEATGAGSTLDLRGLTTITNGLNYNAQLYISADKAANGSGGTIDLSGVTKIQDATGGDSRFRYVSVTADGTGALVNLNALTSLTGDYRGDLQYSYSTLTPKNGGTIQAPALTTLDAAGIVFDGTSTLSTAQITSFTNSGATISGGSPHFDNLVTIHGSVFTVNATMVTLPMAASIDGAQFTVGNLGSGGTLMLPAAMSYTNTTTADREGRTWQAIGAGSTLDLHNLKTITNGLNYNAQLYITAGKAADGSGGTIDLSGLTTVQDGTGGDNRFRLVGITADGSGALVKLNALMTFAPGTFRGDGQYAYSSLTPKNGGTIQIPALKTLNLVSLTLDGSGSLTTSQIVNFTFGALNIVSGAVPDFSNLTDVTGTSFTVDQVAVTLPKAMMIDAVNLTVTNGGKLAMPAATSYTNTTYGDRYHRSFHAQGPGSTIDLHSVSFIGNGINYDAEFSILADQGGQIDLRSTVRMVDGTGGDDRYRAIFVTADGTGSTINLSGLTLLSNTSRGDQRNYSTVKATNSAAITLGSGTTSLQGDVNVILTSNATITAGTLDLEGGSVLNGTGTLGGNLRIVNGTAQVADTNDFVTVAGTYVQTSGTLSGAGNLTIDGMLTWSGGTMSGSGTTAARGGLAISGDANKLLDTRTLDNFGAGTWTGIGNVAFNNGAKFNNMIGATLDAQSDAGFLVGSGAASAFLNAGTFGKSATQGLPTIIAIPFTNNGTVQVSAGTLDLSGTFSNFANNTLSGGSYLVLGATLEFMNAAIQVNAATVVLDGSMAAIVNQSANDAMTNFSTNLAAGSFTVQNGRHEATLSAFSNAGSVAVGASSTFSVPSGSSYTQSGGSTTLAGGSLAAAAVNINGGTLAGSGTITGTIVSAGEIDPVSLNVTGDVNTTGTVAIGSGSLAVSGDYNQNGGSTTLADGSLATTHVFINAGTLSGSGTITGAVSNAGAIDSDSLSVRGDLSNSGTVAIGAGSLNVTGNVDNSGMVAIDSGSLTGSGSASNSGAVVIGAGSLSVLGDYVQSAGSTTLSSGSLTATSVMLNGGSLSGPGTLTGEVTNAGTVSPGGMGTVGLLTIVGDYTQLGTGVLDLQIGGDNPGVDFDQLVIMGNANLAGTLNVTLINGFLPNDMDPFAVLLFNSRNGTDFDAENLEQGNGVTFTPVYDDVDMPGNLTLMASVTPGPGRSSAGDRGASRGRSQRETMPNRVHDAFAVLEPVRQGMEVSVWGHDRDTFFQAVAEGNWNDGWIALLR